MQKKFLLIIISVCILLTISSADASPRIVFTSPASGSTYNVGDTLTVDGSITLDRTLLGATVIFKAYSDRYNTTIPLAKRYFNFQENTPAVFSQINLGNVVWDIGSNTQVSKDWKIIIDIDKSPTYSTTFESGFFSVSKSLPLSASVSSYMLNLGETLVATGTALTAHGASVQGTGNILLEHGDVGTVHIDTVQVKDGFIGLQYPFNKGDPPGTYTLTFKVTDTNGNIGFVVLTGITLSDELDLTCAIPGQEFLPGETISVTGNLKNIHKVPVNKIPVVAYLSPPSGNVTLTFEGVTDANGNYEVVVGTPKLAQPGQYSLRLVAEDADGNAGKCQKEFFLNVERKLVVHLSLNNSWYYNESEIGTEVSIMNKGNTDLAGEVLLLVDGKQVSSTDFFVQPGRETIVKPYWIVDGNKGEHSISAVIKVRNETLFQTTLQVFTIFPAAKPRKVVSPSALQIFVIVGIVVIAILLYTKKKDIRDYFWHLELKRKYGIGK